MRSPRIELPTDPSWLTGPGVAMAVAGLGGGVAAAWLFAWMSPVPDHEWWLETVMFVCTCALTALAVKKSLARAEAWRWALVCAWYGALNGALCAFLYLPVHAEHGQDLVIALCMSPFALVLGGLFGFLFYLGYVPVLLLAQRAQEEPSLDLVSRMAPWCAAWLIAIGLGVGLVGYEQALLGIVCFVAAMLVSAYGLYADGRRRAFLDHLESEDRAPEHHISREPTGDTVLPFVALGDASRTLVHEARAEHGPFRSAAQTAALAAFSADARRERRAITWRLFAHTVLFATALSGPVLVALAHLSG